VTKPSRLEPQTEITRACDFSADVSQLFARERRLYAMRNETFAKAFEAANASHNGRRPIGRDLADGLPSLRWPCWLDSPE